MASSSSSGAGGERGLPDDFMCPILHCIMDDPCIAADGYSYEREAIESWFENSSKSPMTGLELPSTELRDNRALKAAIEAYLEVTGELTGQLDALNKSHVDKDACIRALDAELRRAEAKRGVSNVSLSEYEHLRTENEHLREKLRVAEETLNETLKRKRRRVSGGGENGPDEAADVEADADASTSSTNGCGMRRGPPEEVRTHVAELLTCALADVQDRRRVLVPKLALLRRSGAQASAVCEELEKSVKETERQVEQDEVKVTSARVKLSAAHVDMEEKLRERDAQGRLCIEQAEAVGLDTMAGTLREVQEDPRKLWPGHLAEYARLHLEWIALQEAHRSEMACIGAVEAAASASRASDELARAKLKAASDHSRKLQMELKSLEQAVSSAEEEEGGLEQRREDLLQSFEAAFGPSGTLPTASATQPPSNLTMLQMLQGVFAEHFKRMQEHVQNQVEASLSKQILRLCRPPASGPLAAGFTCADLVELGYTPAELLDREGACSISEVLAAGFPAQEVAETLCKHVPRVRECAHGDMVTHVFTHGHLQVHHARHGAFNDLVSPELQFSAVQDPRLRYSFRLVLRDLHRDGQRTGVGLGFQFMPGPNPESLEWPMPFEKCTLVFRILTSWKGWGPHAEVELDGLLDLEFHHFLDENVYPVLSGIYCEQLLEPQPLGAFLLNARNEGGVAVQCELCLR